MSQSVDKIKPSYPLFREDEYKENLAAKQKVVEERPDQAKMDEVFEWTTTKEYQELNFARESLTINPAKACQPLGAVLCALGFEKTLPYVHGSQGCVAYFRTYFNRHFKEPIACVSDSMTEHAAVFGGQKNMFDGLENAKALYKPEMIAVSTTCMAEVIGDDLNAFIGNSKKEGHIPQEFPTPFAHNPSFVGSHTTGWDNMFEGIQRYFTLNYMDDKEVGSNGTARPRRSRHPHPESDMPNVMIRKNDDGGLLFYVAKKDMEETIANVETDTADAWGGAVELTDGSRWYIDPISPPPSFPTTLRFKRGD